MDKELSSLITPGKLFLTSGAPAPPPTPPPPLQENACSHWDPSRADASAGGSLAEGLKSWWRQKNCDALTCSAVSAKQLSAGSADAKKQKHLYPKRCPGCTISHKHCIVAVALNTTSSYFSLLHPRAKTKRRIPEGFVVSLRMIFPPPAGRRSIGGPACKVQVAVFSPADL